MNVIKELTQLYIRHRFACLFFSLLFTMVAAPVLGALDVSSWFMEVFVAFNILAAVFFTLFSFSLYASLGLLVLFFAARSGYALLGFGPLLPTSQGIAAAICLASALIMLRFMLRRGSIDSERIFAALNVYLMIGLICGVVFSIFEEQWPGSFAIHSSFVHGSKNVLLEHGIYFSYVTLGTLGYGDIIPISGPARALAVVEAIGGQMYLAVVVARLVGLYRTDAVPNDSDQRD
jgi:hypothetical protein